MQLLNGSQARTAAYGWGQVDHCYRSNRPGAYYLSCSGHGGFVVDDRTLTDAERDRLHAAGFKAEGVTVVVDTDTGRIRKVRGLDSFRTLSYRPGTQTVEEHRVWVFEEDCDWAAVYAFTEIRCPKAFSASEEELVEHARESLGRWHPEALAAL